MQATSLCSLKRVLLPCPSSGILMRQSVRPHRSFITVSKKDSFGQHYDGKLVDENMILLRMRIREIEMVEMKTEAQSDWSEMEKKYFVNYDSDICDAVGSLQRMLMNTRPALALGILALLMISMSMSISVIAFHMVEFTKGII